MVSITKLESENQTELGVKRENQIIILLMDMNIEKRTETCKGLPSFTVCTLCLETKDVTKRALKKRHP